MKAKAIAVTAPNTIELVEVELPAPGNGEVLVETAATCVSPGTELRCMGGDAESTAFPYIPGYCQTGTVVECGPGTSIQAGTRVFSGGTDKCSVTTLWGAHLALAIKAENSLIVLPDNLDFLEASTAKLAAISYHGARFSAPAAGKKVAVIGLGPIGQLSARIHHALGADVVGGDLLEARVALLKAAGVKGVNTLSGIKGAFAKYFPEGADVLVDATGVSALIPKILELAKDKPWDNSPVEGARYIIQGSYAAGITIPYMDAFMKEVAFYIPRDMQRMDMEAVLALMAKGRLQTRDIISKVYKPEQAAEAYETLKDTSKVAGTVAFNWKEAS
jgi:3-hydroxyethyl bacteriochlorophyllide a dehydrogenase